MSDPLLPIRQQVAPTYPADAGAGAGDATAGTQGTSGSPPPSSGGGDLPPAQYVGVAQPNKFVSTSGGAGTTSLSAVGQQIGLPYVPDALLNKVNAQTQGDPNRDALGNIIASPAATPEGRAAQVAQGTGIAEDFENNGISAIALITRLAIEAAMDKGQDLSYAQARLDQYQVISKAFAKYASYLQGIQQQLDTKTSAEKDDKKKQNVEVVLDQQLDFNPDSFNDVDSSGNYNPKNIVEGKSDKDKMVTAGSLTTRLQLFSQQRDLLQKEIDKWTTQFQNGLQQQNTLFQQASELIKNVGDSNKNTAHNF